MQHKMMDQQAAGEETSTRNSSTPPPGSDEPADDDSAVVRGDLGASRPRGRWASRSRNRLIYKWPYGAGARDEADGGVRSQAGRQESGSSMVQAHGGGPVHDRAHGPLPTTKMGTQQDEEERSAGISRTVLFPPSYRSGSAGRPADNYFVSGAILGASRPRGRLAADHHRSRSRQNNNYKGYVGVRINQLTDDDQGTVRFQADQDGSNIMDPLHTKINMDQQAEEAGGETSAGMISSAIPPADNFVGGASRRPWESSAGCRSRNRPHKGPYGAGVDCEEGSSTVDRFLPAEHEEYGSVDGLRMKLDRPTDQEETATGTISCTPPVPSSRSGGQPADNFAGEVLIGASRPRGRWDDHYRGRNTSRPNEERSYGGSVRDLPDDEGAVRFQAGVRHDHDHREYRRSVVQAAEYGRTNVRDLQQGGDHHREGARHCDQAAAEHDQGARSNARAQADGGGCLFDQDGHDAYNYSGAHDQQADGGLRVYDNVVVGDPSGVIFGRGNHAGGKVSGRVSGNRVIR